MKNPMEFPELPSGEDFPIFEDLNFSKNWNNKLYCKAWTTIRLSDRINVGSYRDVKLNGVTIYSAKCVSKTAKKLDNITEPMWLLDTGMCAKESVELIKGIYKDYNINWDVQDVYIYVFVQS